MRESARQTLLNALTLRRPVSTVAPAQFFGDIRIAGEGNTLVIKQVVQISIAEVKTR